MNKLILFLLLPTLVFSQGDISASFGEGHYIDKNLDELILEGRYSIPIREHYTHLTASIVFVTDGLNNQTFPRLGVTKYILSKRKNWNRLTIGMQMNDMKTPAEGGKYKTSIFSDDTWSARPFVKFHTPILKLYNPTCCKNKDNKLLMELIIDASTDTFGIGIGVRRRI